MWVTQVVLRCALLMLARWGGCGDRGNGSVGWEGEGKGGGGNWRVEELCLMTPSHPVYNGSREDVEQEKRQPVPGPGSHWK